jgi:acetate kinase
MIILVLNCGSSSVKYQVLNMSTESDYSLLAKGIVERIGLSSGILNHKKGDGNKYVLETSIPDHKTGIKLVLDTLISEENGVLSGLNEINAVGHRVAHGGEYFRSSIVVDDDVKDKIGKCSELAPLHNPANLSGINAISALLPGIPQVAVFDTSFHQTIPEHAYMYAIPYEYYTNYKIRRYGFHGTSHKYVAQKGCELANLDFLNSKIITCHLGNGGSITAIINGKSVDTSMGFTPLEGVIMGTRSGDLDAGIVTFIMEKENMDAAGINSFLNKKCGFLGIYGKSSDARDVESAAAEGDQRAELTLKMFQYKVIKYIGAYAAAMNGVDLIVFTGGIGENDPYLREAVGNSLTYLGVDFSKDANIGMRGKDVILTKPGSKVAMTAICTNEELVIARDTMTLTKQS